MLLSHQALTSFVQSYFKFNISLQFAMYTSKVPMTTKTW